MHVSRSSAYRVPARCVRKEDAPAAEARDRAAANSAFGGRAWEGDRAVLFRCARSWFTSR